MPCRVRRSTADENNRSNGDLVFRMEDWKFERLGTVPWAIILMCVNFLVIFTGWYHCMRVISTSWSIWSDSFGVCCLAMLWLMVNLSNLWNRLRN